MNPFIGLCLLNFTETLISFQKEVEFYLVEILLFLDDHDGHVEGEHELVHFEDSEADVFIYV